MDFPPERSSTWRSTRKIRPAITSTEGITDRDGGPAGEAPAAEPQPADDRHVFAEAQLDLAERTMGFAAPESSCPGATDRPRRSRNYRWRRRSTKKNNAVIACIVISLMRSAVLMSGISSTPGIPDRPPRRDRVLTSIGGRRAVRLVPRGLGPPRRTRGGPGAGPLRRTSPALACSGR